MNKIKFISASLAMSLMIGINVGYAGDERVISHSPKGSMSFGISPDQRMAQLESAGIKPLSRMPTIKKRSQLPASIREMLEKKEASGISPMAYGSSGLFPFTSKRALTSTKGDLAAASYYRKDMMRGIGKLLVRFGASWGLCTGSIIDKGLVLTAAHCVHNFGGGDGGFADEVLFVPMQNGAAKPYGTWQGREWFIPTVYYNGTDVCTLSGVVCENDLALVVMKKKLTGYVGRVVFPALGDSAGGRYSHQSDDYSYTDISYLTGGTSMLATQISQFGYPAALDIGTRMIRTDSLGLQASPSNVIIGSDQSPGSSGGPWFVNYGRDYVSTNSTPVDPQMAIMAVTSWGYVGDPNIKIMGASRFAKNSVFTTASNIDILHDDVCAAYPDYCY